METINKAHHFSLIEVILIVLFITISQSSVAQISSPSNTPLTFGKLNGNAFTEYMRLSTDTGNVGIGILTPTEKLEVNGRIKINSLSGNSYLSVKRDDYESRFWTHTNGLLYIQNSSGIRFTTINNTATMMQINSDGNIGIGTITPTEKLEVNGNMKAYGIYVEGDGAATNTIDSKIDGTIVFGGEDGSTLTNESIATSFYPEFSVWVEDGIVTEDIAIAPNSEWGSSQPDYVFEEEYVLPSLTEIETFIKENKHLEGIPSKSEVIERGWSLPEMDQKLLKKVEELTLYTIQQDKEIKELKAMVISLVSDKK